MWPWERREEVADVLGQKQAASQQVIDAKAEEAAAHQRLQAAAQLVAHSRGVTDELDTEIRKNGWTELLQQAWKGRA